MRPSIEAAPSSRQLRYLRTLAAKTGTTFSYPATRGQASREIDRLRTLDREPREPHPTGRDGDDEEFVYGTAADPSEVSGFGSSASWRVSSGVAARRVAAKTQRVELARYTVSAGERVLQEVTRSGRVNVTDCPISGAGRSYVVEREATADDDAVCAQVADYLEQARLLDDVPMASSAVRQLLREVDTDV